MSAQGDSRHAQPWVDLWELWDSSLVSQPTSVRSASAQARSAVILNLPVTVSLPERSAGWCRCSVRLAAATLVEVAVPGSQAPYTFGTDQAHPLPPPIHVQVSTPQKW